LWGTNLYEFEWQALPHCHRHRSPKQEDNVGMFLTREEFRTKKKMRVRNQRFSQPDNTLPYIAWPSLCHWLLHSTCSKTSHFHDILIFVCHHLHIPYLWLQQFTQRWQSLAFKNLAIKAASHWMMSAPTLSEFFDGFIKDHKSQICFSIKLIWSLDQG
jgi:hypothetical protein